MNTASTLLYEFWYYQMGYLSDAEFENSIARKLYREARSPQMRYSYLTRQQQLIEHLCELQLSYGLLEEGDIERFELVATDTDYDYIDKLTSACAKWTIQGTEKDQARLRRDEIKCLKRVERRLGNQTKTEK